MIENKKLRIRRMIKGSVFHDKRRNGEPVIYISELDSS